MTTPAIRAGRLLPAGLILLSLVPVLAGAVRVGQLAGHAPVPDNARFVASPGPIVVHVVAVTVYSLLGAFQFSARFRSRHWTWHRRAGRVLVAAGLLTGLSGLWMTAWYPDAPTDGTLVRAIRSVVGTAVTVSIVVAVAAIRRRDIPAHRAWMIRAYALSLGAGTQVFTQLPWVVVTHSPPYGYPRALLMLAGWVINWLVAEWAIHRADNPRVALGR